MLRWSGWWMSTMYSYDACPTMFCAHSGLEPDRRWMNWWRKTHWPPGCMRRTGISIRARATTTTFQSSPTSMCAIACLAMKPIRVAGWSVRAAVSTLDCAGPAILIDRDENKLPFRHLDRLTIVLGVDPDLDHDTD